MSLLVLVTDDAVLTACGLTSPDPEALGLAESVERMLNEACNRVARPFAPAESARSERHRGTGTASLWLDYPIEALTSVTLGEDSSAPDETLDVADQTELVWTAGSARLDRVDGGTFGARGAPGYVHVVYDAAEDLPASAAQAVLEMTATLWRRRGSEGLLREQLGSYSVAYANELTQLPTPAWDAAVAAYRVPAIG